MKKIISLFFLLSTFYFLHSPLRTAFAQSPELKSAKQDVADSVDKLAGDKENVDVRRQALEKVINFSIIETQDLIKKISVFKNLPPNYVQLQSLLLDNLEASVEYQKEFLTRLTPDLTIDQIKALAAEFKDWRETVLITELKKALNFVLAFQASAILKISDTRFENISSDLRRLKTSRIINVQLLQPLLQGAGKDLQDARLLHNQVLDALLDYLPAATSTVATSTLPSAGSSEAASSTISISQAPLDIPPLISGILGKIMEAYKKFLAMSQAVDRMIERQ